VPRRPNDIAMHAVRYDFVNKLFYLLHYRRDGVTWLNSRWWLQRYRYSKYVIKSRKRLLSELLVRSVYAAFSHGERYLINNGKNGN